MTLQQLWSHRAAPLALEALGAMAYLTAVILGPLALSLSGAPWTTWHIPLLLSALALCRLDSIAYWVSYRINHYLLSRNQSPSDSAGGNTIIVIIGGFASSALTTLIIDLMTFFPPN